LHNPVAQCNVGMQGWMAAIVERGDDIWQGDSRSARLE
jgi:hypothetical protein